MRKIKPILLAKFNSAVLSGGYLRHFEVLKRGKSEGIDYIVVASLQSYKNAMKMFPDYMETLSNYAAYVNDFKERQSSIPGLKQVFSYGNIFRSALLVSKIAVDEDADLIVGGEEPVSLLTSYLAGKFCSKPWTAVFQPATDLLQPSSSIGFLNAFNVLKFVNEKSSLKNLSLISRIGTALQLFVELKVAQKSLILLVSSSVAEELHSLNPEIRFYVIKPGNGIDLEEFAAKSDVSQKYDAIFFARLIPEKGLYDLPVIWKYVTERIPKAVLGVAGIMEDQRFVNQFLELVSDFHMSRSIAFLGEQKEDALKNLIRSSKLTLYPSLLDSFSLVTLESLACGTPVVAYDIPAIRHNFGKCDAVLRCAIKDKNSMAEKAISIIENVKLRGVLSKRAKEYSANYDWQNVVKAEKHAYFRMTEYFGSTSRAKKD
jgi:glycosyltransferase involved in cell wall biosynthesis